MLHVELFILIVIRLLPQLIGTFPEELRMMSDLTLCFLDNNFFTGSIPEDIWEVFHTLYALTLHANQLTGTIPSSIGLMTTMEEIWFADTGMFQFRTSAPSHFVFILLIRIHHLSFCHSQRYHGNTCV